jgi:AcrR family transcriptional regulator
MTRPRRDRRVARTRHTFGAHVSLVRAKGYEGVGVAEVCAATDVDRSTF